MWALTLNYSLTSPAGICCIWEQISLKCHQTVASFDCGMQKGGVSISLPLGADIKSADAGGPLREGAWQYRLTDRSKSGQRACQLQPGAGMEHGEDVARERRQAEALTLQSSSP